MELDPDFAEGWALLAAVRLVLGGYGFSLGYRSELTKARDAARRALETSSPLASGTCQESSPGLSRCAYRSPEAADDAVGPVLTGATLPG